LGQLPRNGKRWQIGIDTARELEERDRLAIVDNMVKKAVYPEDELDKRKFKPFWSHFSASEVGSALSGKEELNNVMEKAVGFDTVKPPKLIEELISHFSSDSIILDSFAGSGTTAHAVLNLNKVDGGNRKFILVEMEDYANDITSERVKRVTKGYGKEEKKVDGTDGAFDFYELGLPLFDENQNLNEKVDIQKIREYIWFSETRTPFIETNQVSYFLGKKDDSVYYFIYEKNKLTTLDYDALELVKTKGEQYVIYADNCLLPKDFMAKNNIIFKKIPRDITRF
jgi:adenine-specific DNA-methyltransferase